HSTARSLSPFYPSHYPPALHSFPTRRSSDLRRPPSRQALRRAPTLQTPESITHHPQELPGLHRKRHDLWDVPDADHVVFGEALRSEEHTSELQSRENLVCRLLLEKKKNIKQK